MASEISMRAVWASRLKVAVGFCSGATVGGAIGWSIGYAAWHWSGGSDLTWGLLFFVAFVGMLFGLVAPLMLIRYLTDWVNRIGGEPGDTFLADSWAANYAVDMGLGRQMGNYAGYVAIPIFYLGLAGIGMYVYGGGEGFQPLEVLAFFDAIGGGVLGGIIGLELVR